MLTIREEKENDYPIIYRLIKAAFETANVKDGDEQDFAERLRRESGYIPELALVAEQNGELIGHIMLTKTYVDMSEGRFEGLLLAPVSVLLEHRNQGVGSRLIMESMNRARDRGFTAVFLAGDRNYYSRFGFVPARLFGIYFPEELPVDLIDNIMACELFPNALVNVSGALDCPDPCGQLGVDEIREGLALNRKEAEIRRKNP
jgi:putative acetyltransferase